MRCLYSEVLIIRPPLVLVESGLNTEQVSLMKLICIENLGTYTSGLNSKGGLNIE